MRRTGASAARARTPVQSLLAESSVAAAFSVGPDGRLISANGRLAALVGASSAEELLGTALTELTEGSEEWRGWRARVLAGRERDVKLTLRSRDGRRVVLRGDLLAGGDAAADGIEGLFVDVTEEEKLRSAVQRGARMEALGSLTSGVAHDFNNLLTILVGNLYLAAEELRGQPKVFAKLKAARDAAKRGADLVRQLLSFARRQPSETEAVDPVKVVERLEPLLGRALGAKVALRTRAAPGVGLVRCNAAQLESVLVNLSVNAKDAIEEEGRVSIALTQEPLAGKDAARRGLPAGDYVRVSVADNGAGIPGDLRRRVFEPFFTTKSERGGTGLGLSMVRWFAEQCGGAVRLESEPGKGTRVSLFLPCTQEAGEETTGKSAPLSTLPAGEECVLVHARDEDLRSTIRQVLEVLGYEVRVCDGIDETLNALRAKDADLLVVDAAAETTAARRQLLDRARRAKSGIRVILIADAAELSRSQGPAVALLAKPFSIADVARVVRRTLDDEASPARPLR